MKKTNTFIIGAPKCGTTALCHYIQQHPNAFVCEPKEPHHFARVDMPNRAHYITDASKYAALFERAMPHEKVLADGSVWHLYCENAVRLIAEYNSDAKIIIMLRRPDEMVYSFHSQALESYDEDVTDFTTAWKMAVGSIKRKQLPKHCYAPQVLAYDQIAKYGAQLENVYRYFPKNQVKLVFFDDFSKRTKDCYESVLSFLDLEPSDLVSFDKVNENSVVRNRLIGQYLTHPPQVLVNCVKLVKRVFGLKKIGMQDRLLSMNSKSKPRPQLDESTRREIVENYRSDIEKLARLSGIDLSAWLS